MDTRNHWPTTLIEAIRYFADADICREFMVQMRWPNGAITCPECGRDDPRWLANAGVWECRNRHPRKKFSVKKGTIFEDSPIGLDKWLPAVWMIANDKNGISSYEMHRALGVTQKSAWFMLHRIRLAMQAGSFGKLAGQVEADETFIGGKARNMHKEKHDRVITGTGGTDKTAVMGLLERHGLDKTSQVRASVVPNRRKATLQGEVTRHVESGSELFTDALLSYDGLDADYIHQVIDHAEAYVDGNIHTNGIENFWSLLKRSIHGTYVAVEPYHLFRYIDEQCFRFNEREGTDGTRFQKVMGQVDGKRLTYKHLTGKTESDGLWGAGSAVE